MQEASGKYDENIKQHQTAVQYNGLRKNLLRLNLLSCKIIIKYGTQKSNKTLLVCTATKPIQIQINSCKLKKAYNKQSDATS